MDRKRLLLISVLLEGGMVVLGWLLIEPARLHDEFVALVSWRSTAMAFMMSLPVFALLLWLIQTDAPLLAPMKHDLEDRVIPLFRCGKAFDFLVISLLAGVGEEFLFRGWLQHAMGEAMGPGAGLVIASVVFGGAHAISAGYALYAGLIGLYLGGIYGATQNLYIVVFIHALYDFVALLYLTRRIEQQVSLPGADLT